MLKNPMRAASFGSNVYMNEYILYYLFILKRKERKKRKKKKAWE
jgi:hypothetical protein